MPWIYLFIYFLRAEICPVSFMRDKSSVNHKFISLFLLNCNPNRWTFLCNSNTKILIQASYFVGSVCLRVQSRSVQLQSLLNEVQMFFNTSQHYLTLSKRKPADIRCFVMSLFIPARVYINDRLICSTLSEQF